MAPTATAAINMRRGGPGSMSGNKMTTMGTQVRLGIAPFWR
jgi:hypothetical protein